MVDERWNGAIGRRGSGGVNWRKGEQMFRRRLTGRGIVFGETEALCWEKGGGVWRNSGSGADADDSGDDTDGDGDDDGDE